METLLRKPKLATTQPRWIAVDFDGSKWTARRWISVKGFEKGIRQHSSNEGLYFWDCLSSFANQVETWWVCGFNIYEFLCWADMYKAIDSGVISLLRYNGKPCENHSGLRVQLLQGALICENPPTIIDAQMANGAKVKFIDPQNWGLKRSMFRDGDDVQSIDDAVQAIQDYQCLVTSLDMGQLKTTAAAQGMYCFRRSHMRHELWPDDDIHARKLERAAYFAGRCEAYQLGKIDEYLYHLDVTSMYSSFAYHKEFPTRLECVDFEPKISAISKCKPGKQWIADVTIKTKIPHYPLRINGKVMFPVGEFRTVLAWPELKEAIARNHVVKVHRATRYKSAPIFFHFANWYIHSLKQLEVLGLSHIKQCLKLAVNSTYGKIGQRSKNWQDTIQPAAHCKWGQWWQRHPDFRKPVQHRSIDGAIQYLDAGGESPVSMPSISATMSSYGRAAIDMIMSIAGRHNCYYLDTDGVMVNQAGFDALTTAGHCELGVPGSLKVREEGENVTIFGLKNYLFGERYCCAGIPDRNILVQNEYVQFDQHMPFSVGLWHHQAFTHGYHTIKRKRERKYRHGHVLGNGKICPWIVGNITPENERVGDYGNDQSEYAIMGHKDIHARKSSPNAVLPRRYSRCVNGSDSDSDSEKPT